MAFQFASTNLVFELGIVLWLFIGWRFTLAEFVGGLVLIAVMWIALRLLVTREREEEIRTIAAAADAGHVHPTASSELPLRRKLVSLQAWSDVAHNFRGDWQMLWKEIGAGFLIAGYIALLPMDFFNGLFITDAPAPLRIAENVIVGPIVAALAFVCSIGNVPLAAVLWAGGISFSGVVAFLFADLLIPPIIAYYRKVYGGRFAALARRGHGRLGRRRRARRRRAVLARGLVPSHRPSVDSIAERPVTWNYTSVLDILFALVFVALIAPDAPARREGPGLRHDRRPPRRRPDVRLRREDVLLLRRALQAPLRRAARARSARARAALPALTPRLTREARDDRAAHEPAAAVAAEQVDAQRRLAERQLDARRVAGQLARLAHLVVAARIGALADPELPRR